MIQPHISSAWRKHAAPPVHTLTRQKRITCCQPLYQTARVRTPRAAYKVVITSLRMNHSMNPNMIKIHIPAASIPPIMVKSYFVCQRLTANVTREAGACNAAHEHRASVRRTWKAYSVRTTKHDKVSPIAMKTTRVS